MSSYSLKEKEYRHHSVLKIDDMINTFKKARIISDFIKSAFELHTKTLFDQKIPKSTSRKIALFDNFIVSED